MLQTMHLCFASGLSFVPSFLQAVLHKALVIQESVLYWDLVLLASSNYIFRMFHIYMYIYDIHISLLKLPYLYKWVLKSSLESCIPRCYFRFIADKAVEIHEAKQSSDSEPFFLLFYFYF